MTKLNWRGWTDFENIFFIAFHLKKQSPTDIITCGALVPIMLYYLLINFWV